MRICLVYDHLYPVTVGGGERWMHDLAAALARAGHEVTYLTMRHWDGTRAVPRRRGGRACSCGLRLRRKPPLARPPLRFGVAVARYLLRHGGRFDVVHTAAFPYFPLLGASVVRRRHRYRLAADWYEVWTRSYWQRSAGVAVGTVGWAVQRLCIRVRHDAFCMSRHTERRLLEEGFGGRHAVLPGLYAGPVAPAAATGVYPLVVFAGRHVKEKRLPLLVRGFAAARRDVPDLRLEVFGDGPDRAAAEAEAERLEWRSRLVPRSPAAARGRARVRSCRLRRDGVGARRLRARRRRSGRTGHAECRGGRTGERGRRARRGRCQRRGRGGVDPQSVGAAIVKAVRGGPALRASTIAWFHENADGLRIERSIELVTRAYTRGDR